MVHSGLVGIIDIPLVLTVMLCSDSEVTYGLGGGGGGSFTRLNPIHTCTTVSYKKKTFTPFPTVLMPKPHAHVPI